MRILFGNTRLRLYSNRELRITGSISMAPGKVTLIQGDNAAGKTIVLNSIASVLGTEEHGPIDTLDRTTVQVVGRTAHSSTLAWVRQNPRDNFVGRCSADEIILPLLHPRVSARDIEDRLDDLLVKADVARRDLLERPIAQLSAGEQQKAAVCAAVAARPWALLLDEAFARLDTDGQRAVALLVQASCAESAIVVSAHEAGKVAQLFSSAAVLPHVVERDGDQIRCKESSMPDSEAPNLDPRQQLEGLKTTDLAEVTDLDQPLNDSGDIVPRQWVRVIPAHGVAKLTGRHIEVSVGRSVIARSHNFYIGEGLTILIGQNGSGKSTLGELLTGGIPLNPILPRALARTGTGELVPTEAGHGMPRTLRKRGLAVHLPAEPHRWLVEEDVRTEIWMPKRPDHARSVSPVLDRFGISPEAVIGELSYGQQKAVCLVSLPPDLDLVCLDEPFAGVSRESARVLRDYVLERIRARAWRCVLLTAADLATLRHAFYSSP